MRVLQEVRVVFQEGVGGACRRGQQSASRIEQQSHEVDHGVNTLQILLTQLDASVFGRGDRNVLHSWGEGLQHVLDGLTDASLSALPVPSDVVDGLLNIRQFVKNDL